MAWLPAATVMETFFASALLAAMTALAWIAYKHPRAFKANVGYPLLWPIISSTVMIAFISIVASHFAISNLDEYVSRHVLEEKPVLEAYVNAVKQIYAWEIGALIIGGVATVYLLILIRLPRLLGLEERADKDKG
jgi:hypothetical protein